MMAFLSGVIAMILIAVGAGFILTSEFDRSSQDVYVSRNDKAVRLGEGAAGRDRYASGLDSPRVYPVPEQTNRRRNVRLDSVRLDGE